jgi:hypothetical protein
VVLVPRVVTSIALLCAAAFAVAGCSGSPVFDREAYSDMFSKKVDWFKTPDWAKGNHDNVKLGPTGPVAPEDLVAADGRCAPKAEPAPTAAAPAAPSAPPAAASNRRVGSVAGDLAGAPMRANAAAPLPDRLEPAGGSSGPIVASGIALGMSECDVVRRAGQPSNVSIGAGKKGERKVVISYLGGDWPGIYEFYSGRLKNIEAVPQAEKSAKAKRSVRKKRAPARTAHEGVRVYVQ